MSIRRRAIEARVERNRQWANGVEEHRRALEKFHDEIHADTYENLFLRSGQLGHYSGTVIRP
jgi:ribosomal protein L19E